MIGSALGLVGQGLSTLTELGSVICNFYLSVAVGTMVRADQSLSWKRRVLAILSVVARKAASCTEKETSALFPSSSLPSPPGWPRGKASASTEVDLEPVSRRPMTVK